MRKPKQIDDENPDWTSVDFATAVLGEEILPAAALAAFAKVRGRPKTLDPKVPVSIRLSREVVAHFRGSGEGWQTRIDEALKAVIAKTKAG